MKKMPEFTVGGTPRLQKAFVDVLGVRHYGGAFDKSYDYLYGDHLVSSVNQARQKRDAHFDLPQDWDIAMDYAREFYNINKVPTPTSCIECGNPKETKGLVCNLCRDEKEKEKKEPQSALEKVILGELLIWDRDEMELKHELTKSLSKAIRKRFAIFESVLGYERK